MYRAIVLGELGYTSRNCGQLHGASKSTFNFQSEEEHRVRKGEEM